MVSSVCVWIKNETPLLTTFFYTGEMERDVFIGHGVSSILLDRTMKCSDAYEIGICKDCGFIGCEKTCPVCNSHMIEKVDMPYGSKLLFQELIALGIDVRCDV